MAKLLFMQMSLMFVNLVYAKEAATPGVKAGAEDRDLNLNSNDDTTVTLQKWASPEFMSGLLTMLFFIFVTWNGMTMLGAITVPPYQLSLKDKDGKEIKKDWKAIWGNIEA